MSDIENVENEEDELIEELEEAGGLAELERVEMEQESLENHKLCSLDNECSEEDGEKCISYTIDFEFDDGFKYEETGKMCGTVEDLNCGLLCAEKHLKGSI